MEGTEVPEVKEGEEGEEGVGPEEYENLEKGPEDLEDEGEEEGEGEEPGLNFSAQNDVRVGLQWEYFFGKCSSKLLRLFGLNRRKSLLKVLPEKSSHCSPLQPTITWRFQSGG